MNGGIVDRPDPTCLVHAERNLVEFGLGGRICWVVDIIDNYLGFARDFNCQPCLSIFLFLYLSILMYLCLSHLSLYLFQIWPLFFGIVELQLSGNANLNGWQSSTKSGNCVSFFSVVNAEKQITVVSQMKDNLYKLKMIKMWRKAVKAEKNTIVSQENSR